MNILAATGNEHKKIELSEILKDHRVAVPQELGLSFDFEETEATFLGNSLGKAEALWAQVREAGLDDTWTVLADDSGLVVPSLGGEPGIYSARYGSDVFGRMLESPERNAYLLDKMQGITDRRAFFVCCMSLIMHDYRIYTVQETMEGTIIDKELGSGGFGYDPVFYLPEYQQTVAQIPSEVKNSISHRGKAGSRIAALLA